MQILLEVSEELKKYIEYIPTEVLPSILTDLILLGIQQKSQRRQIQEESNQELYKMLQEWKEEINSSNRPIQHTANLVPIGEPKIENNIGLQKAVSVVQMEDEDLGELLDLMK